MKYSAHKKIWLAGISLAICLLAEILLQGGLLNPLDQKLQDFWFQWQGKRTEPAHAVLVTIDEETLAAYPDDPMVFWTDRLATAIARLREAGVTAVGLDMLLSISPERWLGKHGGDLQKLAREYDRPFREQLHSGRVVMASTCIGTGKSEADYLLPSPDYLLALPDFDIPGHVALADLIDDGDGIVRHYRITPFADISNGSKHHDLPVLSLPALTALVSKNLESSASGWSLGGRQIKQNQPAEPIPYYGPPGTFRRISLKNLLSEKYQEFLNGLRGKVVLIGATAAGLNDDHFTPYATRLFAGRGGLMPGVEIHANVLESLLSGDRLQPLRNEIRQLSVVFVAITATVAFSRLSALTGTILWFISLPVCIAGGFIAFRMGIIVPVTGYAVLTAAALLSVLGWRLTGEELEQARVRQLFGRYVSDQVVDELLKTGQRPELGGQLQSMTVLFSDIRNFTTISEHLNAKEVVELLNSYFEQACVPLLSEGGSIDKFIGDAIMVEFGSPLPLEDHAVRAIRAAIALRQVAEEFSGWVRHRFPDRNLPDFAIGIGLHSGEAVIGNIGSPTRMEFTAIGDTVNLASRLEGMTKALGCVILASEATIIEAGDAVVCGKSDRITVKGRKAVVNVFEVLAVIGEEKCHV